MSYGIKDVDFGEIHNIFKMYMSHVHPVNINGAWCYNFQQVIISYGYLRNRGLSEKEQVRIAREIKEVYYDLYPIDPKAPLGLGRWS